jgi:PAS domain S-box-containing protein
LLEIFNIVDADTRRIIPDVAAIGCRRDADVAPSYLLLRPDGSELPIEGSVAPIHDREGHCTGAVIVIRDVSAAQAMARRMANAAAHLAKQNTRLSQANDELASLIRSSPIAIYATDAEGKVTMWSPAAERLSGFSAEECLGRALPIVPQDLRAEDRDLVRRVCSGERLSNIALTRQRKDGSMVELSVSMGLLTDESCVPRGVISLAENVTEEISQRRKVERMQSEFVATVSHELRTPLTSIGGSLGLVASGAAGAVSERAARLIDIANNNTQRLIRLVNDILDIEKLQFGHMMFHFGPVAVEELVAQTITANLPYAASFGIELRRDGPSVDVCIKADPDRLTQALTNLISNAVKFSPLGAVVDIRTALTAQGVRISVADQGPGIAEEFRPRIFQRFAQADASNMRQKGGSGLGLSIAREIVLRHDGQVSFDTEIGKGTTFHLDFTVLGAHELIPPPAADPQTARVLACTLETPGSDTASGAVHDDHMPPGSPTLAWIITPSERVHGHRASRCEKASTNRPSVLHVEDDGDVVEVVRQALQEQFHVVAAPTLEKARHYLARGRFDLVILDLTLSDGVGKDLIPTLATAAGGPIPIVVFTAQDATPELAELVKTVLTKSKSNLATLVEVVRSILSAEQQRDYISVETYDATTQNSLH